MIENITIVDKNGNGILAEGLMYINVKPTNTKYVFYTLNEMVDADQTKIYIAETADAVGQASPIEDEEWKYLKKTMVSIGHKEELPDIEHIKMTGVTFNISEPKKLAIKLPVKQALKDTQFAKTLNSVTEPVVGNAGGNTYFDQSLVQEEVVETPQMVDQGVNIFSNPPQPIVDPIQAAPVQTIETPIVQETAPVTPVVQTQLIDTTVEGGPQFIETPTAPTVVQETVQPESNKFAEEPVLGTPATSINENVLVEETDLTMPAEKKTEEPAQEVETKEITETVENNGVSKEQAVDAMVTLIKYLGISNELSEQIVSGIKETATNMPKEEIKTVETPTEIVETPVEAKVEEVQTIAPVQETSSLLGGSSLLNSNPTGGMATPILETSPIMGIIQNTSAQQATPIAETPVVESVPEIKPEVQMVEMPAEVQTPVVETAPVAEVAQQEPVVEEFKNPMSYEATGTVPGTSSPIANIIDTSVQGIQAAAPQNPIEQPLNPGLVDVEFATPEVVIPEAPATGTLQPTTPPPSMDDNYIPDVTPVAQPVEDYAHTAKNNSGQVVIQTSEPGQVEGPSVVMPDNAKNVQMVTQGMQGQMALGPSGLVADPKSLNLVA